MPHNTNVADRSLFSLSWPILIDLLLHFLTPLINIIMVGHLSTQYLAAMTAGNQVFDLCITIFSFISVGCSVVIAQYLGARRTEQAKKAIHISIAFNFLVGLTFAVILFFFGYTGLKIINTPAEVIDNSFTYLHILGICLIPEAVSLILAACLRVYGKAHAAMYVTLIANLITVVGNMIVLYGFFGLPQLGLLGVAWSTVLGRVVSVILLACLLSYGLRIRFEIKYFISWSKDLLGQILHIGLPAAGENVLWSLHYITAGAFIALLGVTSLAAQSIYFQLSLFIMMFGIAVSIGNEIQVGYLVGEKRFEDAYRRTFRSLKLGVGVTLLIVIVFWLSGPWLMTLLSEDQAVITTVLPLFLLSVFLEPGRTINIVMVNALRASGDAKFPLYMAIISMWGVSIPLGYFLGIKMEMGIVGIWIGFFCDEWLRGIAHAWRWKSKRWQTKRLNVDRD
jgi:putative MATE family efflux protein